MEKIKKRIEYIDNLKAFAIFTVVLGHSLSLIWGDWRGVDMPLYTFIYSFHMPLFMFLSGICVSKDRISNKIILQKIKSLLWPYILWSFIIMCCIKGGNILDDILFKLHGGCWFLLCLFEIFILFVPLIKLEKRLNPNSKLFIDLMFWGGTIVILFIIYRLIAETKFDIVFNLDMLNIHWKFFIFGYLVKKHDLVERILCNKRVHAVAVVLFVILIYLKIEHTEQVPLHILFYMFLSGLGIIVFYVYFKSIKFPLNIQKALNLIGRHTLDIYVIHLIFFMGLNSLYPFLESLKDNFIVVFSICTFFSIANIILCAFISTFLSQNVYVSLFLFGRK